MKETRIILETILNPKEQQSTAKNPNLRQGNFLSFFLLELKANAKIYTHSMYLF